MAYVTSFVFGDSTRVRGGDPRRKRLDPFHPCERERRAERCTMRLNGVRHRFETVTCSAHRRRCRLCRYRLPCGRIGIAPDVAWIQGFRPRTHITAESPSRGFRKTWRQTGVITRVSDTAPSERWSGFAQTTFFAKCTGGSADPQHKLNRDDGDSGNAPDARDEPDPAGAIVKRATTT